jgi:hypothetical protein
MSGHDLLYKLARKRMANEQWRQLIAGTLTQASVGRSEQRGMNNAVADEDFREGMDALLNQRTPNWKGK